MKYDTYSSLVLRSLWSYDLIKCSKNIFHYTASDSTVLNTYNNAFGVNALQGYLGLFVGTNFYSGSFQELRSYWGETLSHETHRKHALEPFMYAGNTISSSYDTLVLRHPLGSTDIETLDGGAGTNTLQLSGSNLDLSDITLLNFDTIIVADGDTFIS